jgi:hypothetical protein
VNAAVPLVRAGGPEFELICLAARLDFGVGEIARIGSLVAEGLDWSAFLASVERNFVAPVVHRNLRSIAGSGVPAKVLDTMRVRSKITAFKNELFADELARISQLFDARSIQTINYKGAVTAQQYYGSVALRNFNDVDFLVRRDDLTAMFEILEQEGYRNSEQLTAKELDHYLEEFKEFLFKRGEISIEPHWSLSARRYPFDTDYEGFWRRSRALRFRGTDLRVMSDEDSLLVLCLVGAKGRWQRLQMVTDVTACLRACPNIDWASVVAMAAVTGTERILSLGLLMAVDLGGAHVPDQLDRAARKSEPVQKLARDVVKSLAVAPTPPRFLPDNPAIFSPFLFRQRERYRDQWRYFWRTTTTPAAIHLRRFPLPAVAFPLYWILVPLHDFVMYPAWKFGEALLARGRC